MLLEEEKYNQTGVCMYVIYDKHYSMWKACACRGGHQYDQDHYTCIQDINITGTTIQDINMTTHWATHIPQSPNQLCDHV